MANHLSIIIQIAVFLLVTWRAGEGGGLSTLIDKEIVY